MWDESVALLSPGLQPAGLAAAIQKPLLGRAVADRLAENVACRQDCLFGDHTRCRRGATAMLGTWRSAGLRNITGVWTWFDDLLGSR